MTLTLPREINRNGFVRIVIVLKLSQAILVASEDMSYLFNEL